MHRRTDEEPLIDLARRGDRRAFGELTGKYRTRLESLVQSRMGPLARRKVDVDDVVQECFVRAMDLLGSFTWRGEDSFLHWLGRIAENLIRNASQKERRNPSMELVVEVPGSGLSPSRATRRDERFDRLEQALRGLPPDYREVILLSRIEGLKLHEVAQRMGRSPEAARQLVVRALRKLRESFGDTESLHLPDRRLQSGGDTARDGAGGREDGQT